MFRREHKMGLPILFLMGYSLVLGTYEATKGKKKISSKDLFGDIVRYEKLMKK